MADRPHEFISAVQLADAVAGMLSEFREGLPDGGSRRLRRLQRSYSRLPKAERAAYRSRFPVQYDHWVCSTDRPKPPPVAEQAELFDQETLTSIRIASTLQRVGRRRH